MMCTQTITLTLIDDQGVEIEHVLPAKFEVCSRCRGEGKHVNPSIDGNGISVEQFREDPDFEEDYFSGVYDLTCEECDGLRVVPIVDEERCDKELLAKYERQQEELAYIESIHRAEMRAEMWASGERC